MDIRIIKNIEEAKIAWNTLSPAECIYDTWDFRYCFYKYTPSELFFYIAYEKEIPIALLPLQYNVDENSLEFFGGSFMENNKVFYKSGYESVVPLLYDQIHQPAKLEYISGDDSFTTKLPLHDYKYILPLDTITSSEEYLEKYFPQKDKKEIRRKLRRIEEEGQVKSLLNQNADLELLFEWNIEKFKDDSTFTLNFRKEIFRDILNGPFETYLHTFIQNNEKIGVSMSVVYKGNFISLNSGLRSIAPKNFRTYLNLYKIDFAIEKGEQIFDAESNDCGWKESWHFQKLPLYKFSYPQV